ncbi:MAG: glycine cleavage system aminomethyltransferase GcvT [Pseudomonadota bacterium]
MAHLTALASAHERAGARMVTFAGWQLPVQYRSVLEEHRAVRSAAGMFDVSHMMITDFSGEGASAWLRELLCSDVATLKEPGAGRYTCALNPEGGVIDDLIVFRRPSRNGKAAWRTVSNAGTRERVGAWFDERLRAWDGPELVRTQRDDLSMIAVQGPHAVDRSMPVLAATLGGSDDRSLDGLPRFHALEAGEIFISRTGYTGEDGVEVCLPHDQVMPLWDRLQREARVEPCGLAARDVLRLEAGLNLHGSDMDEATRPQEVGLRWLLDLEDAQREFVGRAAVDPARDAAPSRFLRRGLRLVEKGVPRAGCEVLAGAQSDGAVVVGTITSGSFSTSLGHGIALWRMQGDAREAVEAGGLFVQIRQRRVRAELTAPPFVRAGA